MILNLNMQKLVSLILLSVFIFSAIAGDDGCCSVDTSLQESAASAIYSVDVGSADNGPMECACAFCIHCVRCGNLISIFNSSSGLTPTGPNNPIIPSYISPRAPSPLLAALTRPPIS